ncbi:MAG: hypothetical protein NC912_03895 [Candidatus Omnitrophica bacterium]|nr:hypothetical protein [Candidatus Omnitrophota bacterium]
MINLKNRYFLIFCGAIVALFIFRFLISSIPFNEEAKVRRFIFKGKRALEKKDILTCAQLISLNYKDKYGNNRDSLIGITKEFFAYYKEITLAIEKMDIYFNQTKDTAKVELLVLAICRRREGINESLFEGEKGKVCLRLVKEDKAWQLKEIEFLEELKIMGERII